jgi:hypothetical protein
MRHNQEVSMTTNAEERMKILRMIEENRISADQAALLLNSLEERPGEAPALPASQAPASEMPVAPARTGKPVERGEGKPAWFRVQVTNMSTGKPKVHVRLPLSLLGWGLKLGARYTDEFNGIDMDELMEALRSGQDGKLIEVMDEEDGEHVEIFVE